MADDETTGSRISASQTRGADGNVDCASGADLETFALSLYAIRQKHGGLADGVCVR
jgi:hypothetical protein